MQNRYSWRENKSFLLSASVLLMATFAIEIPAMYYTKGTLAYPMDDVFIHMAIAKNIALHGVWGSNPYEFASASSSILYPIVLAGVYLFTGPNIAVPLIVSIVASLVFLWSVQQWLKKNGCSHTQQSIILILSVILIPLPIIILTGMEHSLQILLCWLFLIRFADFIATSNGFQSEKRVPWKVLVLGALVTAIRYEGMFLICTTCLILVYYKQWYNAILLGAISMLPVVGFGVYSVYQHSFFFPNPVLLKSTPLPTTFDGIIAFLFDGIFQKIYYGSADVSSVAMKFLLFILPATYFLFLPTVQVKKQYKILLLQLMGGTLLHLSFANTTWFFRYEAYLVAASLPITSFLLLKYGSELLIVKSQKATGIAIGMGILLLTPYCLRSIEGFTNTKGACVNLYEQDYLAGKFLEKYYDSTRVAVNDLGAMSFYTSAKNLDFWGLGNIDVARSKKFNYYSFELLDSLVKREKIKIAVLPDNRFDGMAANWHKIATWHINHRIYLGVPNLCFYAVDTALSANLRQNLINFQKELPVGVTVFYHRPSSPPAAGPSLVVGSR